MSQDSTPPIEATAQNGASNRSVLAPIISIVTGRQLPPVPPCEPLNPATASSRVLENYVKRQRAIRKQKHPQQPEKVGQSIRVTQKLCQMHPRQFGSPYHYIRKFYNLTVELDLMGFPLTDRFKCGLLFKKLALIGQPRYDTRKRKFGKIVGKEMVFHHRRFLFIKNRERQKQMLEQQRSRHQEPQEQTMPDQTTTEQAP